MQSLTQNKNQNWFLFQLQFAFKSLNIKKKHILSHSAKNRAALHCCFKDFDKFIQTSLIQRVSISICETKYVRVIMKLALYGYKHQRLAKRYQWAEATLHAWSRQHIWAWDTPLYKRLEDPITNKSTNRTEGTKRWTFSFRTFQKLNSEIQNKINIIYIKYFPFNYRKISKWKQNNARW